MNKEFIVALLRKDIDELAMLTEGFEEMSHFPEVILELAEQKTRSLLKNLHELQLLSEKEAEEQSQQEISAIVSAIASKQLEPDLPAEPMEISDEIFDESHNEEFQEELEVDEISVDNRFIPFNKPERVTPRQEPAPEPAPMEIEQQKLTVSIPEPTASLSDKLENEGRSSLSDTIAGQKIDDIRQAISIGDRFRFQRELFENSGEKMNKTIAGLNDLSSYEDALSYIRKRFNWDEEDESVIAFLELIRKKF